MWAQGCLTAPAPPAPSSAAAGMESPVAKATQGQGTHLFLSQPIAARLHPQPPLFTLYPVYLCLCMLPVPTHMHLVYLSFPVTPSYTHTPYTHTFPSDCIPCAPLCSCRLNIRDHCGYVLAVCRRPCRALLYVCPRCTVQTSIDSIYIPASAISQSVPCCSLR